MKCQPRVGALAHAAAQRIPELVPYWTVPAAARGAMSKQAAAVAHHGFLGRAKRRHRNRDGW